jgi:hypothetical protein
LNVLRDLVGHVLVSVSKLVVRIVVIRPAV